jgi:SAM-dependent methyltransferase
MNQEYLNKIKPYFKYCNNKTVLEIGPMGGWHTDLILKESPKNIILVEPNPLLAKNLKNLFPEQSVVEMDIFKYVENKQHIDVVVCCGVLYHFHSSIYLLEQIVNNLTPTYLIIESIFTKKYPLFLIDEIDNIDGNRYTTNKSAKISIIFNIELLNKIMKNMNYNLIDSENVSVSADKWDSKSNVNVLVYKNN